MANENDKITPDGSEKQDPKHHTWIDGITEDIQKLDTEFPLSGGETEEDLDSAIESDEEPKKTSFFEDLDTEFPLSGGEVER